MALIKNLLLAVAAMVSLPTSSTAYLSTLVAPGIAHPGDRINVTLQTAIYIQNYEEFGIIWGLSRPAQSCATCVGRQISYTDLL